MNKIDEVNNRNAMLQQSDLEKLLFIHSFIKFRQHETNT